VYIEPYAIVEPTNALKEKQMEYEIEQHRIFNAMCQCIRNNMQQIQRSIHAFATIDIYRAKALIGERLNGVIPEVSFFFLSFEFKYHYSLCRYKQKATFIVSMQSIPY
jgi:dsDNA-specific endonuclease/ATPase MutS2